MWLVVAKNVIYCFTFIHYVLIELFHYVRSTVHDRVGFILGVLAHSVACKATDLMLIYNICCFDIIDICTIIIMIVNGEGFKITDQVQCEAKPSRFVVKLCNTFFGVLGSGYLTSCGEWRWQLGTWRSSVGLELNGFVLPATRRDMLLIHT